MTSAGKHLLLLAAFLHLARCQTRPTVVMRPELSQVFNGDLLYLSCKGASGGTVKWYLNGRESSVTGETWKITSASQADSGSYSCERNGQKSNDLPINVLEYDAIASLTIETGQPVVQPGRSVSLRLEHVKGLSGWRCKYHKGEKKFFKLKSEDNRTVVFHTKPLKEPETIFWCINPGEKLRSNQQVIRTSGKPLSLEINPLPVVPGDNLRMTCLTWGTHQVSRVLFYKGDQLVMDGVNPTFTIHNVTSAAQGKYKCNATYTYVARTAGPPYQEVSETQELVVQARSIKASLSLTDGLSCSCAQCFDDFEYHYYQSDTHGWRFLQSTRSSMKPPSGGIYACRAVFKDRRSLLSDALHYQPNINIMVWIVVLCVIMIVLGGAVLAVAKFWKRDEYNREAVYEDMPLKKRDGDYEKPLRAGGKDGEYETLHAEEAVYHTLGMEEGAGGGGEGGYEALRKEGMKAEVYHTLGKEGGAGGGGEGGYEALKKEGMTAEVYQTLGEEGGAVGGGEGGYEALKREGMNKELYQTLGAPGGQDRKEGDGGENLTDKS